MKKKRKKSYGLRGKKAKPIYRKKWFWLAVGVIFFLTVLFYLFFVSAVFRIEKIVFQTADYSQNDLFIASFDWRGKPILFFSAKEAAADILRKLPYLESVEVKKRLPNKILADKIIPRIGLFEFCLASSSESYFRENCFVIDKTFGKFEPKEKTALPLLLSEAEVISLDDLEKIRQIGEFFQSNIPFKKIFFGRQKNLTVFAVAGFVVHFNLSDNDVADKLSLLEILLENQISLERQKTLQYIDLRYSKVFYK